MAEPDDPSVVHWTCDPGQQAAAIHCDVCRTCRWRDTVRHGFCLYGGPFEGVIVPPDTIDRDAQP